MLRINHRGARTTTVRLDSDRDTLPFPTGGVRRPDDIHTDVAGPDAPRSHADVLAHVDHIQRGIDTLRIDLDDDAAGTIRSLTSVIARIGSTTKGGGYTPPTAA